jgi:hypothetical protein
MHVSLVAAAPSLAFRTMPKGKEWPRIQNVSDKASSAFDVKQNAVDQKFVWRRPQWPGGQAGRRVKWQIQLPSLYIVR